ncbi:alpha-tectorin-like [Channa argus]|uniref:alpha-tectorin-like n=1 Tax=Channa argus TaxID=215402 RepID=UPI00352007BE
MLHLLIYLSALSLMAGADEYRSFSASSVLDISSCPITFYGQTYEQIYVSFTSENVSICFNDFYNPQTTGDCVVGPKAKIDSVYFTISPSDPSSEYILISAIPTIKNHLQCLLLFTFILDQMTMVFDAHVSGTTVDSWNVTGSTFADISGCRYSGNVYKPGTSVLLSSSGTCLNVSCNETAVLSTQVLTGNSKLKKSSPLTLHRAGIASVIARACLLDTTTTPTVTSPTVSIETITDSTIPTVSIETITDSTIPTVSIETITESTIPTVTIDTITDSTIPTVSIETITESTIPTVTIDTITDSTIPTVSIETITDSTSPTVTTDTIPDSTTPTCTVTGSTVIDFNGQVNSVQDRCVYSLVSDDNIPDFLVLGNFQERRRKGVSFLESVKLRLDGSGVLIHLEQGGRVQLDDTTLTLNSSTQLVHGVELSKDQTGVTVKVSLSNYTTSVFFDGYTAQISLTGPGLPSHLSGLCGNSSSSLSELRLPNYSVSGCEIQYNDTADSTINCTTMTERCNLLKEAPFTTCNSLNDPQPYVTACTNTLCKYPAVDGLSCQFLKAYSRACNLQNNETVGDWWTKAGCSAPQAFCQDRTCSPHEFCGEKTDGGETRCFCRALFASKYTSTHSLGGPTICSQDSASLSLVGCLLEDKGIDYSTLHLNDQTCRGHMDQQTHMVTFSFNNSNTCGAVVTTNNSQVIYKNAITNQNSSSDIITRHDQIYIDFSCVETKPDIKTMSFSIKDSSVIQHITSGAWSYTLTMKAYTNAKRTQAVEPSTEVQLDQRIWVELKTDGLDDSLVAVVTDSCWATSEPSPSGSLRYDLIINGCANPTDQTVKVEGNGLGTSNYFTFNMFQFTGKSGDIYLHCKLQLCVKENNDCVPVCNAASRRRRSLRSKYEAAAFITMAWTN